MRKFITSWVLAVSVLTISINAHAALLLTNEGEAQMLSVVFGKASPETLVLKLYANDKFPAEADTSASYTEASGGGYAAVNLSAGSWTVTPGAPTEGVHAQVVWTFSGGLTSNTTIYGYYVMGGTSGKVYWAERLSAPFTPANSGDVLRVTPKFTQE